MNTKEVNDNEANDNMVNDHWSKASRYFELSLSKCGESEEIMIANGLAELEMIPDQVISKFV